MTIPAGGVTSVQFHGKLTLTVSHYAGDKMVGICSTRRPLAKRTTFRIPAIKETDRS